MAVYQYKGLTKAGASTKGIVDADNMRAAKLKLKKDGIFVTDIKDKKKESSNASKKTPSFLKARVDVRTLALMTRQLATLLKANVPLVDSLGAVTEQTEHPTLKEAMADIRSQVNEGSPFHKALAKYPHIFDGIFVSMCEAGEMSGTLEIILIRLAEFTESAADLKSKVSSAMTYPAIMLISTIGLLSFLALSVIPGMKDVFSSFPDLQLPWYTIMVFNASSVLQSYWYVFLIVSFFSVSLFLTWKKTPQGRQSWDAISLKLPFMGRMNQMVAVSRFTRTLATLLTGGVAMLQALQICRTVVDNHVLAQAVDSARSNISEGESISGPLKKSGQFPPLVIHMVSIGEKTGELENMLIQVSDAYDFQVKTEIEKLTGLMNPLILLIMGGVISLIVFAILMPMFELQGQFN